MAICNEKSAYTGAVSLHNWLESEEKKHFK